jgi:hypothetical protein
MLWRVVTHAADRKMRLPPSSNPAVRLSRSVRRMVPAGRSELKHDGYRLQIHIRDGRVKLYTMNAADWTKRYPRIVEQAAKIKGSAIIDAEAVWLDTDGIAQFDALHSRVMDHAAVACAFDLLMPTAMICDGNHFPNVRLRCAKCCAARKAAFNTSNIPKAMVQKCSKQSASSAWKGSFQNELTRPIALARRKAGSR